MSLTFFIIIFVFSFLLIVISGIKIYYYFNFNVIFSNNLIDFIEFISLFFICYIISKSLKEYEVQRSITFGDFFVYFLCIAMSPIGVWFLQPKLNKIIT
jgi:hypothetical protein